MKARTAGFWDPPTSDLTSHRKQEKMQRFIPQLGKELSQGPPQGSQGVLTSPSPSLSLSLSVCPAAGLAGFPSGVTLTLWSR